MTEGVERHKCDECDYSRKVLAPAADLVVCECSSSNHHQHVLAAAHPACEIWVKRVEEDMRRLGLVYND